MVILNVILKVILKVILNVIKLKKNLLVRKMEAARGMLKQPKSRSDTERLIMKMAVVFLTWKMMEMLLLLILIMMMMMLKNMVIIVVMMKRRVGGRTVLVVESKGESENK